MSDPIHLEPGTYVVAVSGGIDSMTLLDHLVKSIEVDYKDRPAKLRPRLVVAHFDHGIRTDSHYDRKLVHSVASKHKLPFVFSEGNLGRGASETEAREARYSFLKQVQRASGARAIITAHHQDDSVETAVINLKRGTGRKGITSMTDHHELRRPLLSMSKAELVSYAKDQGLVWREDSTNKDNAILRNYIRSKLMQVRDHNSKSYTQLVDAVKKMRKTNQELDNLIEVFLHTQTSRNKLDRQQFIQLPHDVSKEVMASWLRNQDITTFNSPLLEDLVIKCKSLSTGKQIDIDNNNKIVVNKDNLALVSSDR